MLKEYTLRGLDCANCAAKIEAHVKVMAGVSSATLNFMTATLTLEADDNLRHSITDAVSRVVRKHEPNVVVVEKDSGAGECLTVKYTLQGLDCANCAAKIEASVKKLDGVRAASVNFMTRTLALEADGSLRHSITEAVTRVVHQYEPDVGVIEIKERGHGHAHNKEGDGKSAVTTLVIGAVVFAVGMILSRLASVSSIVTLAVFMLSYTILGGKIAWTALKNISRGQVFDENFLMSVASIGAFIIGEHPEAVAVMLFYQVGELFQEMAVRKSKRSITELMDIRPDFANIKKNGAIIKCPPETVRIGDIMVVKPGERIPLDGVVIEGESMLDTRALTGESVPRSARVNDTVLSGCINQNGVLTVEVTKTFGESTVAKIIDLVENASGKKAQTENFITTFSRYYTPVVVSLAALIAVIPPLFFSGHWADWVNRGLIFLVISCPCALVVSIPLGFFGGIGGASRKGILIKGSNYLEALNKLDIVVFDKTGTLTKGVFEVTEVEAAQGFTLGALLEIAAHAEAFSNHPIALSIQRAYGKTIDRDRLSAYQEIPGHGISARVGNQAVLAGNEKLMRENGIVIAESQGIGTKVHIAVDGRFAGCIVISDEIKPDSRGAVSELIAKGVRKTVMLTGDLPQIGEAVAEELGIGEVYAGLLPGEKIEKVEMLSVQKRRGGKLAFVGDGINDAPVLARADVGIAMGALGSDAAIEAADIVLMTDEPSKLAVAVDIARFTRKIVWQNIIFALGIKGVFLLLGAFGYATMWEAVFADVGVALLAVLNATRAMRE